MVLQGAYGRVAVPDVHVDVGHRLAGVGVNQLDVHVQRNTSLVLHDVLADKLASNDCMS